jgi:hypothetical protein
MVRPTSHSFKPHYLSQRDHFPSLMYLQTLIISLAEKQGNFLDYSQSYAALTYIRAMLLLFVPIYFDPFLLSSFSPPSFNMLGFNCCRKKKKTQVRNFELTHKSSAKYGENIKKIVNVMKLQKAKFATRLEEVKMKEKKCLLAHKDFPWQA